ncbi:MAG: RagB/SusD family nutrient uptake outer membrane protein [Rikenellaceae bacterium]|nr:RagB/SusD family nutrient uptake outer membrane protein [Rikenellaceae bacterium]
MKKIFIGLMALASLVSMTSCEDFINQPIPDTTNEPLVFSKAEYIEANLNGCYHYFKSTSSMNYTFMGGKTYAALDSRGDDVVNISNQQTLKDTYEMNVLGSNELENGPTWVMAYAIINECNVFIDNMAAYNPVGNGVITQAVADQYIAEAKFLRGYTYYVLCQLYSQPYCVNPESPAVPLRLTGLKSSGNNNCPLSSISAIYAQILDDCKPEALASQTLKTRATADAARMLKMRVQMAMGQWSEAIKTGKEITGYTLVSDMTTLYGNFDEDTYANTEMIFVLPMTAQDSPNTQSSVADYYSLNAQVGWLDTEAGILSKEAYCLETDQRISALTEMGETYLYSKKFTNIGTKTDWVPQMRYAETLLNLAECYANVGDRESLDNAKAALKTVRSRAIAEGDVLDVDALEGKTAIMEAVYNERRAEFICEGMRGIDIARRGENFIKKNSFADINIAPGDSRYVWPIPDSEYAYNKALEK